MAELLRVLLTFASVSRATVSGAGGASSAATDRSSDDGTGSARAQLDDASQLAQRVLRECAALAADASGAGWLPVSLIDSLLALLQTRAASAPTTAQRAALLAQHDAIAQLLAQYKRAMSLVD